MNMDISALQQQLKTEKNHKGEIASKFKFTDKSSSDYAELLTAMQTISRKIKALEAEIKTREATTKVQPEAEPPTTKKPPPIPVIDPNNHWQGSFSFKTLATDRFNSWDQYLTQIASSTYHQSVWFKLIQKAFGHETHILVAIDDAENILGGVPLTFFSSAIFGKFAVSIPYVNYGGVTSNYFNIATALLKHAQTLCTEKQLSHVEIRTMQQGLAEDSLDKKVSMLLELPATDEALEKQLGSKVRAQYKKAEEYNPEYKIGKLDLLNDFYSVFARNMRDLGTPVYSKKWFEYVLSAPEVKSAIIVVYMNNQPVSTGFLVGSKTMLEIPWASTIQSANGKNANMWMYRKILSYAVTEGYSYFDFGRSTMGAGTFKFKKQWGAEPYQHHWYYLLENGSAKPELNPDNPKFKLFIFMWKLMPVWLTKVIGPHIIKNIP